MQFFCAKKSPPNRTVKSYPNRRFFRRFTFRDFIAKFFSTWFQCSGNFLSQSVPSSFTSTIKDTISGVWPPKNHSDTCHGIKCHQMCSHTHIHILYTRTPYLKIRVVSDFCRDMLGQDKGRIFIARFKFLSRGNRSKNRISEPSDLILFVATNGVIFPRRKNRLVWTGTKDSSFEWFLSHFPKPKESWLMRAQKVVWLVIINTASENSASQPVNSTFWCKTITKKF